MSSAAAMAARSAFRSTLARAPISARLTKGAKVKSPSSPFGIPKQNPLSQSHRILRSPVELSCCVESLLPYHSATASALLTSMLSVSRRSYGWTPEALSPASISLSKIGFRIVRDCSLLNLAKRLAV